MAHRFLDPFPKYLQIREILMRRIERELRVGDRLPTERTLCQEFGVSRETIRDAWRGLEDAGIISRSRGQGTFVARLPPAAREKRLTGLSEDFTRFKLDTEARVLSKGPMLAQPAIARLMAMPPDELVYRIFRLRFVERQPFALHEAFLPLDVGVRVARLDLRNMSIVHALRHTLRLDICEDHQQIEALAADTEAAHLLGLGIGSPILSVVRHFSIGDDHPIVLFRSYYRADRYYYTVQLAQATRGRRAGRTQANGRARRVGRNEARDTNAAGRNHSRVLFD